MANSLISITIDDSSPTIFYAPFGDTFGQPQPNITAGWYPYYTGSGFSTGSNSSGSVVSNIGKGTSLHVTACDGAEVAIQWNGTAISVFGTITANNTSTLSYSVALDGNATTNYFSRISSPASVNTAAIDVLASFSNLSDEPHEIVLTVHNAGSTDGGGDSTDLVALDNFELFMDGNGPPMTASSTTSSPLQAPTTTSIPDDAVSYNGEWSFVTGLLPGLPDASFHTSTSLGDSARVDFNGTAVSLSGLTSPCSGTYNVTLDDRYFPTLDARASFTSSSPVVLFYLADLDPTVPHSLEIVNAGAASGQNGTVAELIVLAGGINVTMAGNATATSSSTSRGLSGGAIAAIAIGATLGFILVLSAIVLVVYWRRRRARRKESFLVNPRVSYWQRNWPHLFSSRAGSMVPRDTVFMGEKDRTWRNSLRPNRGPDVLQIGRPILPREKEEDYGMYGAPDVGVAGHSARPRHASQNSDGSFSIELPELSAVPLRNPTSPFPTTPEPPSLGSQTSAPLLTSSATPTNTLTRFTSLSSPRSARPRGPREMHGRDNSRGILLSQMFTPTCDPDEGENASPLRVGFANQSQTRSERRPERYLSAGGISLPVSLKQALARSNANDNEAGPSRPPTLFSFMDFSSSSSGTTSRSRSLRQSSNSKRSTRSSARSRRESGAQSTQPPVPSDRRGSLGLSMTMAGGPTESRPSLTPEISLRTVSIPPTLTLPTDVPPLPTSDSGLNASDPIGMLPSPSDSIPLTVSDIHFRHSVQSSASPITESRRTSAIRSSGSHRPPHPPLPGSEPSSSQVHHAHSHSQGTIARPYIVQRLMGLPVTAPVSLANTPTASPTVPSMPRPDLEESLSRGSLGRGRPRTAGEPQTRISRSASRAARPETPGSTPASPNLSFGSRTAFGFLGRHR